MKRLMVLAFLAGCGQHTRVIQGPAGNPGAVGPSGPAGSNGESVKGDKGDPGESITGPQGNPGQDAQDGLSSLISVVPAPSCPTGGSTILVGLDANRDSVLDITEVSQSADICNGEQGSQGEAGENGQDAPATAFTPVALVDPCGDADGILDEVLIQLNNGTLITSVSNNGNAQTTRLSVVDAGTYSTTDGSSCTFTVDGSGNVSW